MRCCGSARDVMFSSQRPSSVPPAAPAIGTFRRRLECPPVRLPPLSTPSQFYTATAYAAPPHNGPATTLSLCSPRCGSRHRRLPPVCSTPSLHARFHKPFSRQTRPHLPVFNWPMALLRMEVVGCSCSRHIRPGCWRVRGTGEQCLLWTGSCWQAMGGGGVHHAALRSRLRSPLRCPPPPTSGTDLPSLDGWRQSARCYFLLSPRSSGSTALQPPDHP